MGFTRLPLLPAAFRVLDYLTHMPQAVVGRCAVIQRGGLCIQSRLLLVVVVCHFASADCVWAGSGRGAAVAGRAAAVDAGGPHPAARRGPGAMNPPQEWMARGAAGFASCSPTRDWSPDIATGVGLGAAACGPGSSTACRQGCSSGTADSAWS
jgi:hypothetical protein